AGERLVPPSQRLLGHGGLVRNARCSERRLIFRQRGGNVVYAGQGLSLSERNSREGADADLPCPRGKTGNPHQRWTRPPANDAQTSRSSPRRACQSCVEPDRRQNLP